MRRAALAALLSLIPLTGCVAAEASTSSKRLTPATVTVTKGEQASVLRIDGIITPEVGEAFEAAMNSLPVGEPLMLELNSPGGYTSAGYRMIDRIMAEREAGRQVATAVRGGESCESMCVGLYMAGASRYAAPTAQFMVHAPRGLNSGTVTVKSTGRMIDRLIGLGASVTWIEQVKQAGGFSGQVDYRTTAADLTRDGANVVTMLVP